MGPDLVFLPWSSCPPQALLATIATSNQPPREVQLPVYAAVDHKDICEFLDICEGKLATTQRWLVEQAQRDFGSN